MPPPRRSPWAVDRDDSLASFSGRGPRFGDEGLKPEITAPGVGIVAARAAGTSMPTPVDGKYTAASGTSMAAPHVAGAAALLAQQHPDWDATRLKDALVSTAKRDADLTVFEQGGGRVDVARAVRQQVYATGVVDFGLQLHSGKPVAKSVTYANDTAAPVTLDLTVDIAAALGSSRVVVPAGGTVDVPVTVDPAKLGRGRHSGWVTASAPGSVAVRKLLAELPDAWQDVPTAAGPAAYRLELTTARESEEWQRATRTETVWEFRSSGVDRVLPLLQVDYRLHGRTLDLTLRNQESLPAPRGTSLRLDLSTDDGRTWTPARVTGHGIHFSAKLPHGMISLRVHAYSTTGSVKQTVIRAC